MSRAFWLTCYVLLLLIHYPGLAYLFFGPIPKLLRIKRGLSKLCLWFVVWLGMGLVFNGCICGYGEQYCLLKAGKIDKITYRFEDSLAYKFVFRFL